MTVSTVGNALIVVVLYRTIAIRTSANIFIGNMAIADFLQCLMFTVTGIGTSIQHNYPMGGFWCRSDTFLKYWFLNVSQLSLIALSVDRVTGIFKPFWKKLTPSVTAFVCLTLWIVSLLITLWLAFYRSLAHREWSDFSEVLCYETDVDQAIWVTFTAVLVYLPLVSMLLFYHLILLRLRQLRRRFPDNESIDTQQATIMKMIYFYLMSSLICWAPQQYLKYNRQFFHLQYTVSHPSLLIEGEVSFAITPVVSVAKVAAGDVLCLSSVCCPERRPQSHHIWDG